MRKELKSNHNQWRQYSETLDAHMRALKFLRNEQKQEIKTEKPSFFSSIFGSSKSSVPVVQQKPKLINPLKLTSGIYLYGTPGCGKTFLMDMFYNSIHFKEKDRIHFNEFMLKIHDNLNKLNQVITIDKLKWAIDLI